MIADQSTAKHISELMLRFSTELDDSVKVVQENCPEDELSKYRRAVGSIMAEILLEVLNPLYSTHPTLTPPGFK